MEIKQQKILSEKIKLVLNPTLKKSLSDTEISEILFNLQGFAQTLLKMKMEVKKNGK